MAKNSNNLDRTNTPELPWAISIGFGLLTLGLSWQLFLAITLTSTVGWAVRRFQQEQKQQQELLNSLFYQLIEENQGHITTLDLAMKAKLPANVVQEFLDRQARDFGAHYEITDQGGVIYYFPTALSLLSTEGEQVDNLNLDFLSNSSRKEVSKDEVSNNRKSQKVPKEKLNNKKLDFSSLVPKLLTQVELANRLKVHPSTISKRKTKSDFLQWSREKDPETIAWEYSRETKRFSPKVDAERG